MPDEDEDREAAEGGAGPVGRPFWSGTLSFGLVSIPVSLFPATRHASVALRMLAPDGTPLARRYYCPQDGGELTSDQLVRGFELDDGSYVTVSDEELEAVDPKKSRDVDLRAFVPAQQIDPLYFDRSYVLTAGSESTKAYRLLAELMEREGRAGIATFVMREKEYLIAIFARGGILRAETLRFHDEVRSAEDIELPERARVDAGLVKSFARAIAELAADELDADQLRADHAAALRDVIERKRKRGQDVVTSEQLPAGQDSEVIDLLDVLRRSLRGEPAGKKATARRSARRVDRIRGPRTPAKVMPDTAQLEALSKSELLERARELDVPRRSQMSKAELIRAVQRGRAAG